MDKTKKQIINEAIENVNRDIAYENRRFVETKVNAILNHQHKIEELQAQIRECEERIEQLRDEVRNFKLRPEESTCSILGTHND